MFIDIMDTHSCIRVGAYDEVIAEGREDATRTVVEKGKPFAAKIVLVGAAYAGKERMTVVHLPGDTSH